MLAELCVGLVADNDLDLALIDNGVELGLDLGVQDLTDVLELEACLVVSLADTDTDHVALTGMHNAFHAVEELVNLTLEDGLEVGLHGLASNLDGVAQRNLEPAGNSSISGPTTSILWSSTSVASLVETSSKQSLREPSTSICISPLRMISPSNAEEKETGMSIFVIFSLMPRASMEVSIQSLVSS